MFSSFFSSRSGGPHDVVFCVKFPPPGPLQQRGNGKDVDAKRIVLCNSNAPSCTTFVSLAREHKQQEKVLQKQNYQDSKGNKKEMLSPK